MGRIRGGVDGRLVRDLDECGGVGALEMALLGRVEVHRDVDLSNGGLWWYGNFGVRRGYRWFCESLCESVEAVT